MDYKIYPPEEILETSVVLPLSKSVSARAMVMAALGASAPKDTAVCDDTKAMSNALEGSSDTVDIGAAGTAMRFLTAYYAIQPNKVTTLTGSERMCERPIGTLVEAMRKLGAHIEYVGNDGFPPLKIYGATMQGGEIDIDASVSSQYISALLMIAPLMSRGLTVNLKGDTVSMPYIKMTVEMMKARGIEVEICGNQIIVQVGRYVGGPTEMERDWSAAAFWYEIAALSAGWVTLPGMNKKSLQGDRTVADLFPRLGVVTEWDEESAELSASPDIYSRFDVEMSQTPDLVQACAVTACALGIPFHITGIGNLRIKETDRIEALRKELLKLGCIAECEGESSISWDGKRIPIASIPIIETYHDHRMAMAFAPLALFIPGIIIKDVEVVSKSYPDFWTHLKNAGFTLHDTSTPEEQWKQPQ